MPLLLIMARISPSEINRLGSIGWLSLMMGTASLGQK